MQTKYRLPTQVLYAISPFYAALIVFLLAITGACGQLLDIPLLKSIIVGYPSMAIGSAIGITLIACGTLLIAGIPNTGKLQKKISHIYTLFVISLAAANFLAVLLSSLDTNATIDFFTLSVNKQILFVSSHYTASGLLLLSLSLFLQNQDSNKRYIQHGQLLALLTLALLFIVLLGYLYSMPILFRNENGTGMAIHTWLALFMLSIALLNINKNIGFPAFYYGPGMGSDMMRVILPLFILIVIVLAVPSAQFSAPTFFHTKIFALIIIPIFIAAAQILIHQSILFNKQETVLLKERTHYQDLFEGNPDAVVVTNDHGEIVEVNQQAVYLTGFYRKDLIGLPVEKLINLSSSTTSKPLAFLKSPERHEKNLYLELYCADEQIHPVHILVRSALIQDQQVNILSIRGQIESDQTTNQIEPLDFETYHDTLTSLPNKRMLLTQLEMILNQAKRNHSQIAVAYCDLDNFKNINNLYGNAAGNAFLKQTGQRIIQTLRKADIVARVGSDEFIIVLTQINGKSGVITALNKLVKSMSHPFRFNNITENISLSIGISLFPDHGHEQEELISKADFAMYLAKKNVDKPFFFFEDS